MEDFATTLPPSIWASINSWFTSTVFFVLLNLMIATILFTSNLPNNNPQNHNQQQQNQNQNSQNDRNQPQIARSPSILHRLKSFNFNPQISQPDLSPDPLQVAATQYVFNQPLYYQHFDSDSTNSDQVSTDGQFPSLNRTHTVETVINHFDFDPTRKQIREDTGFDFNQIHEEEHADEFQSLDEVYSRLKGGGGHVNRTKSDGDFTPAPAKMKKSASLKVGFSHFEEEEIVETRRPATVRERTLAVKTVDDDDDVEVDARADDFINKFKNDLKLQRIESIIRTKGATTRGTGK